MDMGRMTFRQCSMPLIFASILTVAATAAAGQPPASAADSELRAAVETARKAVEAYKAGGGLPATANHPAIAADAALWAIRERHAGTDAAARAAAEAVRLLVRAELWDRADARIASIGFDDPAWARLAAPVYDAGIARKDLGAAIGTLSRAAASATNPTNKAAVLVVLGRAHRRAGDPAAATRALDEAKSAAPGSLHAEEAEGLLYEIKYLSPGMSAPPLSGKARNGRRVDLAALRGRPVVLVFWGST
jgi:tetratricopeptide (TPR) repeat protein